MTTNLDHFSLCNSHGTEVGVINFGATITSIKVRNSDGELQEVTLGFDSPEDYIHHRTYMGPIAGRVANRIARGKFVLDGKEYHLDCNNGPNHLHGGPKGWAKLFWDVVSSDSNYVQLKLHSPDGNEGYPGNVDVKITYTIDGTNTLSILIEATTDAPTLVNPTSHCYFNFHKDHSKTILDHVLQIHAEHYTPSDAGLVPTGAIDPVYNTPMDFRNPKDVGQDINADFDQLHNANGYDHNWVLDKFNKSIRKVATLSCPSTGISMETWTDQPGIQCYTGNSLGKYTGRGGLTYGPYTGICLETQGFPDAVNNPNFPSIVLRPGEKYRHETKYVFYTI